MIFEEEIIRVAMNAVLLIGIYRIAYVLFARFTLASVLYFWQSIGGVLWKAEDALYWVLNILSYGCILGGFYSIYIINYLDFFGIDPLFTGKKNPAG